MINPPPPPTVGYGIVVAGVALAFVSAVVPFYTTGYRLDGGVLIAGLLPYLVYAPAVVLLRRPLTIVGGLVLAGIHAWLVVRERFMDGADYSDGLIYYVPLALTLLLLSLTVAAVRQPWHD